MTKPFNILLIEDGQGDIALVERALEEIGIDSVLYTVNDGEEATEFFRSTKKDKDNQRIRIDLIFLDMRLLDILENVIINEQSPPVILTGKKVTPEIVPESLSIGAVDFMEKPLSLEKLLVLSNKSHQKQSNVPNKTVY